MLYLIFLLIVSFFYLCFKSGEDRGYEKGLLKGREEGFEIYDLS